MIPYCAFEKGGIEMDVCISCGGSLAGAELTLPWEDGDNSHAYVRCPHCGFENIKYGYGDDD